MWECTRDFEWFVTEYSGIVRVLLEFFGSAALSVIALAQSAQLVTGLGAGQLQEGIVCGRRTDGPCSVGKPELGALQIGVILNWMLLSVF